eukprot:SAG31_NODE_3878_length_3791_cov_2.674702_1_plen_87_part_00
MLVAWAGPRVQRASTSAAVSSRKRKANQSPSRRCQVTALEVQPRRRQFNTARIQIIAGGRTMGPDYAWGDHGSRYTEFSIAGEAGT